jgi:hypothetical protein
LVVTNNVRTLEKNTEKKLKYSGALCILAGKEIEFKKSHTLVDAFNVLLVPLERIDGGERLVALVAANAADASQMLTHVPRERFLVLQNYAANSALGAAQVVLVVRHAVQPRTVRFQTQAAQKPVVTFDYLNGRH